MTVGKPHYPASWQRLIIAVLGGDEREQEICRCAAETGASVRGFGFPWPSGGLRGVTPAEDAVQALAGSHVALMPIPGIATDGSLFGSARIIPGEPLLRNMASGAHIILGRADDGLRKAAAALGVGIHEYEADEELMLLRAPAIVEGLIGVVIQNTAITIHAARICVVGQGTIGTVLTRTLLALGAHVTVVARNPIQRAAAYGMGAVPLTLEALPHACADFDVLISTIPAPVVTPAVIDRLPASALIIDVAAPPGSCDLDYSSHSGRKAIWARALGRRAPITVGRSQWLGIARIIEDILAEARGDAG